MLKEVKDLRLEKAQMIEDHAKQIEELKKQLANQEIKQFRTPRGEKIEQNKIPGE